jgi:hypothetical protein
MAMRGQGEAGLSRYIQLGSVAERLQPSGTLYRERPGHCEGARGHTPIKTRCYVSAPLIRLRAPLESKRTLRQ